MTSAFRQAKEHDAWNERQIHVSNTAGETVGGYEKVTYYKTITYMKNGIPSRRYEMFPMWHGWYYLKSGWTAKVEAKTEQEVIDLIKAKAERGVPAGRPSRIVSDCE